MRRKVSTALLVLAGLSGRVPEVWVNGGFRGTCGPDSAGTRETAPFAYQARA